MQDNASKTGQSDRQPVHSTAEPVMFRKGHRRVVMAALASLADLVLFFPLFVAVAVYAVQKDNAGFWLATLLIPSVCGAWLAASVSRATVEKQNRPTFKRRIAIVEIPLAVLTGLGVAYWVNGSQHVIGLGLCTLAWTLLWLMSAHHYRTDLGVTLVPLYIVGLLVHFVALFFFHHLVPLRPWAVSVTSSGLVGLAITYLALNESRLNGLILDKDMSRGLPKSVTSYNRVLVAGISIVLWLIFAIRVLQREASRIWWGLVNAFYRILGWLSALLNHGSPVKEQPHPQGKSPFGFFKHVQTPGPNHLTTFEIIVLCLVIAVLVFALVWLVWRKLIPMIRNWYKNYMRVQDDVGYVDEQETIRPEPNLKPRKRRRRGGRHPEPWERLSATEKVRYLYRTLVEQVQNRGYVVKQSLTANETTEDLKQWANSTNLYDKTALSELSRLYDAARYGDRSVPSSDIERVKENLQKRNQ